MTQCFTERSGTIHYRVRDLDAVFIGFILNTMEKAQHNNGPVNLKNLLLFPFAKV